METTLGELVGRLGGELVGDPSVVVRQIAALDKAGEGDLAFLASPKYRSALEASKASAFILSPKAADFTDRPRILTPDPYLYFARAAQLFNPPKAVPAGIHPSAVVASGLPASVSVGPNAVIGVDCRIGEGAVIGAGCCRNAHGKTFRYVVNGDGGHDEGDIGPHAAAFHFLDMFVRQAAV